MADQPTEKLQKVLARAGVASRREAEGWIQSGRVQVNGDTAQLGDRVDAAAEIHVDGKPLSGRRRASQRTRVLLYHKPAGEVTTRVDPEGRPTVFRHLPRVFPGRWIAVGRLDINTTGLMLFTTDGELAHRLMHPGTPLDREYLVRVFGEVDADMRQRLATGVLLEDGVARFTDLRAGEGDGVNRWYYVVTLEGRNRIVRRLFESQGLQVNRLKRVRIGPIFLPSAVRQGRSRELTGEEIEELCAFTGLPLPAEYGPPDAAAVRRDSKPRPQQKSRRRNR
ncbi:MAG: pseudouridine synthase [Pseudomonadota bacterium]|nr:pseudouridine synthase [Pseudomonadota bacterium]